MLHQIHSEVNNISTINFKGLRRLFQIKCNFLCSPHIFVIYLCSPQIYFWQQFVSEYFVCGHWSNILLAPARQRHVWQQHRSAKESCDVIDPPSKKNWPTTPKKLTNPPQKLPRWKKTTHPDGKSILKGGSNIKVQITNQSLVRFINSKQFFTGWFLDNTSNNIAYGSLPLKYMLFCCEEILWKRKQEVASSPEHSRICVWRWNLTTGWHWVAVLPQTWAWINDLGVQCTFKDCSLVAGWCQVQQIIQILKFSMI